MKVVENFRSKKMDEKTDKIRCFFVILIVVVLLTALSALIYYANSIQISVVNLKNELHAVKSKYDDLEKIVHTNSANSIAIKLLLIKQNIHSAHEIISKNNINTPNGIVELNFALSNLKCADGLIDNILILGTAAPDFSKISEGVKNNINKIAIFLDAFHKNETLLDATIMDVENYIDNLCSNFGKVGRQSVNNDAILKNNYAFVGKSTTMITGMKNPKGVTTDSFRFQENSWRNNFLDTMEFTFKKMISRIKIILLSNFIIINKIDNPSSSAMTAANNYNFGSIDGQIWLKTNLHNMLIQSRIGSIANNQRLYSSSLKNVLTTLSLAIPINQRNVTKIGTTNDGATNITADSIIQKIKWLLTDGSLPIFPQIDITKSLDDLDVAISQYTI